MPLCSEAGAKCQMELPNVEVWRMNRQEAIDILSTHYEPDDQRLEQALDMAIEALKAPHWISCKERLPEFTHRGGRG